MNIRKSMISFTKISFKIPRTNKTLEFAEICKPYHNLCDIISPHLIEEKQRFQDLSPSHAAKYNVPFSSELSLFSLFHLNAVGKGKVACGPGRKGLSVAERTRCFPMQGCSEVTYSPEKQAV